jgi:hypothetical protein
MESLSEVLDPIVDDLSHQETIDVKTIGCDLIGLLTFINNKTLPKGASMVEIIATMSNNTQMMNNFSKFSTMWSNSVAGSSDGKLNTDNDAAVLRCFKGFESNRNAFVNTLPSTRVQQNSIVRPSTRGNAT